METELATFDMLSTESEFGCFPCSVNDNLSLRLHNKNSTYFSFAFLSSSCGGDLQEKLYHDAVKWYNGGQQVQLRNIVLRYIKREFSMHCLQKAGTPISSRGKVTPVIELVHYHYLINNAFLLSTLDA